MKLFNLKYLYLVWLCVTISAGPVFSSQVSDQEESESQASVTFSDGIPTPEDDTLSDQDSQESDGEENAKLADLKADLSKAFGDNNFVVVKLSEEELQRVTVEQDLPEVLGYRKNAALGDVGALNLLCAHLVQRWEKTKSRLDAAEIFYWYNKGAEKNDALALSGLANCYFNGVGCKASDRKGLYWLRQAVENGGSLMDKMKLATCLLDAIGCKSTYSNRKKALNLYREVARTGEPLGMAYAGFMLARGMGCIDQGKDLIEANMWLRRASDQGSQACMYMLASNLLLGRGCVKSEVTRREAFELYSTLFESGDNSVQGTLGFLMLNGIGCDVTPENTVVALNHLEASVAAGNLVSMFHVANYLLRDQALNMPSADCSRAFELYRKAAEGGDPESTYAYGYCLQAGIGCAANATNQNYSHLWYSKAILNRVYIPRENLVYCLLFAIGCENKPLNKQIAFGMLQDASTPESLFKSIGLGYMYATGTGVKQDVKKAFKALQPYLFEEGICPLVLSMFLGRKDYKGALLFYQTAINRDAHLAEDPRLEEYLKLKIRLQQQRAQVAPGKGPSHKHGAKIPVPQGKSKNKPAGRGQFQKAAAQGLPSSELDDFDPDCIERDVKDAIKQFYDLREHLRFVLWLHCQMVNQFIVLGQDLCIAESTYSRKVKIHSQVLNNGLNPYAQLEQIKEDFEAFIHSFRTSKDDLSRRTSLSDYMEKLSPIQEEVFMAGLKAEYSPVQGMLEAYLRDVFVKFIRWSDPLKYLG